MSDKAGKHRFKTIRRHHEYEDDSKWSVITSYNPDPFASLPADCRETFREFLTVNRKRWLMADSRADEPTETEG